MSSANGYNDEYDTDFDGSLEWKVGRMVTVFTRSGGRSGRGFTGILVESTPNYIKLITTLPIPPRSPFSSSFGFGGYGGCGGCGGYGGGFGGGFGGYGRRNPLGTVVVIPRSEIVSYVFNEI